ncbi:hypothetical protein [Deinococcus psychrotolerans]|uniref:hypothetical protein n=1 Tax=Deinococcus psychrotolerans TaxID=2489213 RepID=UPI0013DE143E|nr:hypothetical protein [Deinococcus psychrotolerans]
MKQAGSATLFERIWVGTAMGARGVVVGRNVWQSPKMLEMIGSLRQALGQAG